MQERLVAELADAVETLQKCKDEWSNKESKWQAEIKQANKKQQQLADRTALVWRFIGAVHRFKNVMLPLEQLTHMLPGRTLLNENQWLYRSLINSAQHTEMIWQNSKKRYNLAKR